MIFKMRDIGDERKRKMLLNRWFNTHRGHSFGAGIRRTRYAEGLLWLGLIRSLLALHTLVECSIEIGAGLAHRQRTLLDRGGAHIWRGPADRTRLTGSLDSLCPVTSSRTWLALSFHGQLLPGPAFVPAFLPGHGFGRSRCFSQTTQQTGEAALVRLIESVAAASAEAGHVVVILSGWTTFLAISRATSTWAHCHAGTSSYHGAGTALQLTRLALVASDGTRETLLRFFVVERSHGTGHWNSSETGVRSGFRGSPRAISILSLEIETFP